MQKVKAIQQWPQPRNVQEVRQFYGLVNYYRRFIRHFSLIVAPLSDLFKSENGDQRKQRPIIWSTLHQTAFERLKNAITMAPVLVQPCNVRVDCGRTTGCATGEAGSVVMDAPTAPISGERLIVVDGLD